jgi:hypothetical protein
MNSGDLGALIALISVVSGIGILAGAFAGAYFFGKSRGQRENLNLAKDPELLARISRVEQIVEATAVEIERISEGQRFTTRLLHERQQLQK